MTEQRALDQLNHLVQINVDAADGFQAAADAIKNSELETTFKGYATQHAHFLAELQDEVKRLGGTVSNQGSLSGAMHRGWMDLKSALTGNSAASLLASCVDAEQSVEIAYTDATNIVTSGQTHTLIEKQCTQIKGFRTRLARLLAETKDGVDFQKNE